MLRAILGCTLIPLFCSGLSADEKKADAIDAKKLVGKWTPEGKDEQVKFTIEFKQDGKAVLHAFELKETFDATYKVEGNKLSIAVKIGSKEQTTTLTVTRLTDAELVGTNDAGKGVTLTRTKDK